MGKGKLQLRLLGKQVWCVDCIDKRPPTIQKADFLIPARTGHYDMLPDNAVIDKRVVGICKSCLLDRSEFQRRNTQRVNVDHENLVYM